MNKTVTTIIVVILLLVGGVWLFSADSGNQTPAADSQTQANEPVKEDNVSDAPDQSPAPADTDTASAQPEPQGEVNSVTVRYTQSGFSPQQVDVQSGTTVMFVNETDRPMWVASDVHPSHTQYAGTSLREHCQSGAGSETAFDQCESGQRFSFTFEKSGEWRYHNHSIASQGGTVVVE